MYDYQTERARIFTDEGVKTLLRIRDQTQDLLDKAGAVRLLEVIAGASGDSWLMLACVDYLVELGELRELTSADVATQNRVFVRYYGRKEA